MQRALNVPRIVFFGSSGHAQSMREVLRGTVDVRPLYDVVAFIDDFRGDRNLELHGAPIVTFETWQRTLRDVPCIVTVADPAARARLAMRLTVAGGRFATCFDPDEIAADVPLGPGTFVTPGLRVGAGAAFGAHVHVFPFAHVAAGCTFGDYVTICPSVRMHGAIAFGAQTFVGAGAAFYAPDGGVLHVGAGARIAAGAVVRRDVRPGAFVYGDPAREARAVTARGVPPQLP